MDRGSEVRRVLCSLFALRLPGSWDDVQLDRFPVANYIVFRDDLEASFEDSHKRLAEARSSLQVRGIEPLFMMDEEGGRVTQLSAFFESAPSPRKDHTVQNSKEDWTRRIPPRRGRGCP